MFGIKTLLISRVKRILFLKISNRQFHEKGYPKWIIQLYLRSIVTEFKNRRMNYNIGWLYNLPHNFAVEVYSHFLHQNSNHLGNFSTNNNEVIGTQKLERQVIQKMINLYHGDSNSLEGYITSGATESNIYSVWAGRKHLEQFVNAHSICVIKTNLTHYSIRKSADITGSPEFITPLDEKSWSMSPKGLEKTISTLYKKGYRGFLIALTIGYTATGTSDNIREIVRAANQIRRIFRDMHIYIWIDAATNGLIEPFMDDSFNPFSSPLVHTIVVDFHKLGLVPYPAGILIYRKELRKLIEKPVDYFSETDSTVSGSRTGSAAAAVWTMISYFGKYGYTNMINRQLHLKNVFMKRLLEILPETQIITLPHSLSCGIIFRSLPKHQLPEYISDKYGLYRMDLKCTFYPSKQYSVVLYKFFFFPDIKSSVLHEFCDDISKI